LSEIINHLITSAEFRESPNHSERLTESEITLMVIHNISLPPGRFGGSHISNFFQNKLDVSADKYFEEIKDLKVSSHLLINRQGEVIQFVPFNKKAWHAGISLFLGQQNCNEFSIGIEMEGTDSVDYTNEQYESLKEVTLSLMKTYPKIIPDNIVGHSDIAPGRKTDPGKSFNWTRYKSDLVT
jgi:AmpD protein|tara:strand:+ start:425 stop:973 length:549 start_codon:yes stop_codon:yes gene_type:complete